MEFEICTAFPKSYDVIVSGAGSAGGLREETIHFGTKTYPISTERLLVLGRAFAKVIRAYLEDERA